MSADCSNRGKLAKRQPNCPQGKPAKTFALRYSAPVKVRAKKRPFKKLGWENIFSLKLR